MSDASAARRPTETLTGYDWRHIHEFSDIPLGHFTVLATRVQAGKRLTVFHTKDRVFGFVLVDVVEKRFSLSADEVLKIASETKFNLLSNVKETVKAAVDRISASGEAKTVGPILVAEGKPKHDGEDAKLQWHVEVALGDEDPTRVKYDAAATQVNYRDVRHVVTVKKDDPILTITPPTKGVAGIDIFGKPIPTEDGHPVAFDAGDGVSANAERTRFIATDTGAVSLDHRKLVVAPVMRVNAVDFSTGNIDYKGRVEVKGDVGEGFTIKAGRELFIGGDVKDAIISCDGSIAVQSLLGRQCRVDCGGSMIAARIVNAVVRCTSRLTVMQEMVNADVQVAGPVNALDAAMVGGRLVCIGPVYIGTLGNDSGSGAAQTVIIDPALLETGPMAAARAKLKQVDGAIGKIASGLGPIAERRSAVKNLPQPKQTVILKLLEQLDSLKVARSALEEEVKELEKPLRANAKYEVYAKRIFPGTSVNLKGAVKTFVEEVSSPVKITMVRGGQSLNVVPWSPGKQDGAKDDEDAADAAGKETTT